MQMRFFQPIADIRTHYENIERHVQDAKWGAMILETWGINKNDHEQIAQIRKEHDAVTYLSNCQLEIAHGKDSVKPDMLVLESALNRQLAFLSDIHDCTSDNWRTNRHKSVQKQYEACRHYLFKLTLPAWVEKLPERIPTFANKYPNFNK